MVTINKKPFGNLRFYNGEAIYSEVQLNNELNTVDVTFETNADLWDLRMAVLFIDNNQPLAKKHLIIKYFPYSRMDRQINSQLFSLEMMATAINELGFEKVFVLDPHSSVLEENLDNMEMLDINQYVDKAIQDFRPDYIFFPDKGAMAKYPKLLNACNEEENPAYEKVHYIYGNKVRDLENKGHIIRYDVVSEVDLSGKRVLIVDDICCKGGTFIWAAQELKKLGVSSVGLYVSHCENSIFEGGIFKTSYVDKVYTTRSLKLKLEIIE